MTAELGSLAIEAVSKTFPGRGEGLLAVDQVSMALTRGEFGVLLGPSGCGKSTILRMTAGLETISSGAIRVSGRVVTGPGRDRGLVFQSYTSFPWLTVEQNVAFGLKVNGASRQFKEGVVDHFIEAVGLDRFRRHYPDQLSGGMRQRVAIARALANEPELLLLDEPFGALDPETRHQMQELVLGIVRREKMTVLMVTHDVDEAIYLGDRIAFLSAHPGRLREMIVPEFKAGTDAMDKDRLREMPQYRDLEAHIITMMREQGRIEAV